MKVTEINSCLELWDENKLEKLWSHFNTLSQADLAFHIAWMTAMIRDDGEIRLSQWLVWLETKSNNQ